MSIEFHSLNIRTKGLKEFHSILFKVISERKSLEIIFGTDKLVISVGNTLPTAIEIYGNWKSIFHDGRLNDKNTKYIAPLLFKINNIKINYKSLKTFGIYNRTIADFIVKNIIQNVSINNPIFFIRSNDFGYNKTLNKEFFYAYSHNLSNYFKLTRDEFFEEKILLASNIKNLDFFNSPYINKALVKFAQVYETKSNERNALDLLRINMLRNKLANIYK